MCTAASYLTRDFYFGRTLDFDWSHGEEVVVLPRRAAIHLRMAGTMACHYAMIGVAHVVGDHPLFYDAVNEKGLGMAGLNFVGNAVYHGECRDKENVASFEFIPWVLGQCAGVEEARALLERTNLTPLAFSPELPPASLHWMIADRSGCLVVESVAGGLQVYDNCVGVLTNNPPFPEQMFQLNNYMGLSTGEPRNCFCASLPLKQYSRGMGAMGLPGDFSSQSRFVRAAFVRLNSVSGDSEEESVGQFFHILGSVSQPKGSCVVEEGKYEMTLYTSCCNASRGIYYFTTYYNRQITGVNMHHTDLEACRLFRFSMDHREQIRMLN